MEHLTKVGRVAFAIGIAGLGLQQFFFPGFRPVFVPSGPEAMPNSQALVYLSSIGLIVSSTFIVFNYKARKTSVLLGSILLLLLLISHIPFQIANNTTSLGGWTNAFKILALSGGAFVVAESFPVSKNVLNTKFFPTLEKLIPVGRMFFAIMLIVFGIDHF